MNFTKSQKKYLKKNIKILPLNEIAANLGVSEKEVHQYLKSRWPEEKYEKFTKNLQNKGTRFHLGGEWFKKEWKVFIFLAILVFTVYFNSLKNDFVSDDIAAIAGNPEIFKITNLYHLELNSFKNFLIQTFFGIIPMAYRMVNIIFHLGSVWLIFTLINLFFNSPLPLITASIFAVHPFLTEGVTWISGAPYSVSAFFIFLTMLTYLLVKSYKNKRLHILSLVAFFIALLFNTKLLVFPLVICLFEFCFGDLKKNWKKLIPYFAISGLWVVYLLGPLGARISSVQSNYIGPGIDNPLIQIPVAITSYLELIFWPKNLTFYHSELIFSPGEYFIRLTGFIFFLIVIFYFFKKDKKIFFWLSFFIITLLPTLTPLRISWIVAERYAYMGSLGIFVLIAWLIQKIGQIGKNKNLVPLVLTLILIPLSVRTIIRNKDWTNQDTLWLATAKISPSSPQNHNNLGDYYGRYGNIERAIEEFKIAIELLPGYADAYHNLANAYQQIGKTNEALDNYQKAVSFNPGLWQSHQNIAAIYFAQGKFTEAISEMESAIKINSNNSDSYVNLGIIYLRINDKSKAKTAFTQALSLNPKNERANLGLIEAKK